MATPAEPVTDALYHALSNPEPDPHVVHTAIEEIRYLSGRNVITEMQAGFTEMQAEMKAEFSKVNSRIDALESRIDVLQRVIWPLIGLLATTVFGLLYRVVTAATG